MDYVSFKLGIIIFFDIIVLIVFGMVFMVMGESGSGKFSLFDFIVGFLKLDFIVLGRFVLNGCDIIGVCV